MYNFREAELGPDFAKEKLADFKSLINASHSFTVVSMPGVGVSYFLKYLVCQDFAYFVHVDLYTLPSLTQHEFYKLLLKELGGKVEEKRDDTIFTECKQLLETLSKKLDKIVIVFSRFDQLKKEFTKEFLAGIQSLTTVSLGKIVVIFTSIKPLYELAPDAVSGGNLPFYSKILYFKPYLKDDLKKLITIEHSLKAHPNLDELIDQSGGHNQLLHIFLNSHKQQNLLLDKFVKLQLKDLIDYLDYHQRKVLQKIALGKKLTEVDEYLLGVGLVKQSTSFQLFTPLLSEYIKTNMPVKLPVKEARLFKLLRKNIGRTITKDEIFASVWADNPDETTDWALDALVYRLRKHQFIQSNGYIIESHKKVGYTLIQP